LRPGKRSTGTRDKEAEKRDVPAKTGQVATLVCFDCFTKRCVILINRHDVIISYVEQKVLSCCCMSLFAAVFFLFNNRVNPGRSETAWKMRKIFLDAPNLLQKEKQK